MDQIVTQGTMSSFSGNYDSIDTSETRGLMVDGNVERSGPQVQENASAEFEDMSVWSCFAPSNLRSVVIENKGAVARDHLANERTFLAWLKTSMSFISLGIAVTQLFKLETSGSKIKVYERNIYLQEGDPVLKKYGKVLGCSFVILGILSLLIGTARFFMVQALLIKNYYPLSRIPISILSFILVVFIISGSVMIVYAL